MPVDKNNNVLVAARSKGYVHLEERAVLYHGSDITVEVAKSLNKALHFNTYGGNPVACAVGSAVIDVSTL